MFEQRSLQVQPSILTFNGKEIGFTQTGFTLDYGVEYNYVYPEETPVNAQGAFIVGAAPIMVVEMLEVDVENSVNVFGAFGSDGGFKYPTEDNQPGTNVFEKEGFTGPLLLSPRISDKGYTVRGFRVLPVIIGSQRFSTVDLLTIRVAFVFLPDEDQNVIDVQGSSPE